MSNESGRGYFPGFLTGLLFGAAAALLLTPKKGEELRQNLAEGAQDLAEGAKAKLADLRGGEAGESDDVEELASDDDDAFRSNSIAAGQPTDEEDVKQTPGYTGETDGDALSATTNNAEEVAAESTEETSNVTPETEGENGEAI